jgi:hypothetical protein
VGGSSSRMTQTSAAKRRLCWMQWRCCRAYWSATAYGGGRNDAMPEPCNLGSSRRLTLQ